MNFNRTILRSHKKLSIIGWLLLSSSWESRWIKARSGRCKRSIILDKFQCLGQVRRIARDCKISSGYVCKVLKQLESEKIIHVTEVNFGGKLKAVKKIEIVDQTFKAIINLLGEHKKTLTSEHKLSTRNTPTSEHIGEQNGEHKTSSTKPDSVNRRVNTYNIQEGRGDSFQKSPTPTKELDPWINA